MRGVAWYGYGHRGRFMSQHLPAWEISGDYSPGDNKQAEELSRFQVSVGVDVRAGIKRPSVGFFSAENN